MVNSPPPPQHTQNPLLSATLNVRLFYSLAGPPPRAFMVGSGTGRAWYVRSQSRHWQSANLFLRSPESGLPQPLTRRWVCPPLLVQGGGAHSLAREGVGEFQFRRRDIHCGTLYIYLLSVYDPQRTSCVYEKIKKSTRKGQTPISQLNFVNTKSKIRLQIANHAIRQQGWKICWKKRKKSFSENANKI
jgi:hypothetical protein